MKKDKKKNPAESSHEIIQTHGYLNDSKSKIVATVSWFEGEPKLDIRKCKVNNDTGELNLFSGISLDKNEVDALTEILVSAKNTGEIQRVSKDGNKAVNFSKIFGEATDIVDKRDKGYTTQDGFIVLKPRPGVNPYNRK